MEDALGAGAGYAGNRLERDSLNPCCNGRCSRSPLGYWRNFLRNSRS